MYSTDATKNAKLNAVRGTCCTIWTVKVMIGEDMDPMVSMWTKGTEKMAPLMAGGWRG